MTGNASGSDGDIILKFAESEVISGYRDIWMNKK
jgi:hypothetical protein